MMKYILSIVLILVVPTALFAANSIISGTISDPLGYVIPAARVSLLENGYTVKTSRADEFGRFRFEIDRSGRYSIEAYAKSFRSVRSETKFLAMPEAAEIDLTLAPSTVVQSLVVTGTGMPTPEAQSGASIRVISGEDLQRKRELQQALGEQSGTQVSQTRQIGGTSALRVRGGATNGNKLLIDGVPANDIGGDAEFAYIPASGYERVEFLRGPNSTLHGSDALASVVNVTTRRGATPLPELTLSIGGGTFGTYNREASIGGAWKRLDYFADYSRFDTRNSTANSQFHNGTYLGNVGYQLTPSTRLRATVWRTVAAFNAANAISRFGIADDGVSREQDTVFSGVIENQAKDRWHNLVRYGGSRLRSQYMNFGPTGLPYDPSGTGLPIAYLGAPVTIRGANGYVVTPQLVAGVAPTLRAPGQAVFQFPDSYPTLSVTLTNRDFIYAQTDYRFKGQLSALLGFRYEDEGGYTASEYGADSSKRGNYSYIAQLQGGLWNRLFYSLGAGVENNAIFGTAITPRSSVAYHLVRPSNTGIFNGTRLSFNFGKGIKEPSIYYDTHSLYRLLQKTDPQLAVQYGIRPFRAETSRSYDGSIEQQLFGGKARATATYFHNQFGDQAEFVSQQYLAQLGVPHQIVLAAQNGPYGGAAVNTLSYRAQGTELEISFRVSEKIAARGGWTYIDAVVQRSFASSALRPAINPLFPNIPIGAYSPLVRARPFRVAPHAGFLAIDWKASRYSISLSGTLLSRRDDSDFLLDANFGNTLLLPNRNLAPAYQKIDLHCSYKLSKNLTTFVSIENLLNQHYEHAFGYPALPFTIRSGMKFLIGGESWKLN